MVIVHKISGRIQARLARSVRTPMFTKLILERDFLHFCHFLDNGVSDTPVDGSMYDVTVSACFAVSCKVFD